MWPGFKLCLCTAALLMVTGSALAELPNEQEAKCQKDTATALRKLVRARVKCVQRCVTTKRRTGGAFADCFGPSFVDPDTHDCILDPLRGAEAKARATIRRACTRDCPECYGAEVCSTGETMVSDLASQIDPYVTSIFCAEAAGDVPSRAEAKCEDATWNALDSFWSAKNKCYQGCQDGMLRGKIPPGSCSPPVPLDDTTSDCVFYGAEGDTRAAILAACSLGQGPDCIDGIRAHEWVDSWEAEFDFREPITHCED